MNAMRLAVGILFVVLASQTCMLAMAQDVEQPSESSVRQADPPEHREFPSAAQGENANRVRPDDRLQTQRLQRPTNGDLRHRQSRSRMTVASTDIAVPLVTTHVPLSTARSRHCS
jgi:hypothetical protein